MAFGDSISKFRSFIRVKLTCGPALPRHSTRAHAIVATGTKTLRGPDRHQQLTLFGCSLAALSVPSLY